MKLRMSIAKKRLSGLTMRGFKPRAVKLPKVRVRQYGRGR